MLLWVDFTTNISKDICHNEDDVFEMYKDYHIGGVSIHNDRYSMYGSMMVNANNKYEAQAIFWHNIAEELENVKVEKVEKPTEEELNDVIETEKVYYY